MHEIRGNVDQTYGKDISERLVVISSIDSSVVVNCLLSA